MNVFVMTALYKDLLEQLRKYIHICYIFFSIFSCLLHRSLMVHQAHCVRFGNSSEMFCNCKDLLRKAIRDKYIKQMKATRIKSISFDLEIPNNVC